MTKKQLRALLQREPTPGYNYTIFSILTSDPATVRAQLVTNRCRIVAEYLRRCPTPSNWSCEYPVQRQRSVLLPIPFDTSLNILSDIVRSLLTAECKIPTWS